MSFLIGCCDGLMFQGIFMCGFAIAEALVNAVSKLEWLGMKGYKLNQEC